MTIRKYFIFDLLWMIVNDGFFYSALFGFWKVIDMKCGCKVFYVRFLFSFVIIHVFDIEIIIHIIPNVDCTRIIPVFNFSFPTDSLNIYSLNFKHEAFHHVPHSHTILYMIYLLITQIPNRSYILRYTSHRRELPILRYHKLMIIYPCPILVIINQLFSCIIFINGLYVY